jgi:hypothetical protein
MTYQLVCNKINTTEGTCGAGTAFLSGAHRLLMMFVLLDLYPKVTNDIRDIINLL